MSPLLLRVPHLVLVVAVSSATVMVACSTTTVTPSNEAPPKDEGEEESDGGDTSREPGPEDAGKDSSTSSAACPECLDNLCENTKATEACAACVKAASANDGECVSAPTAACVADPECRAYGACTNGCKAGGADGGTAADKACFDMGEAACRSCCRTTHKEGSEVITVALEACICGR